MKNLVRNFYFNKYIISPFSKRKYHLSYDIRHKALWFRVYKAATRTIDHHLKKDSKSGEYIYSSEVGYKAGMYKKYFKFTFVRNPISRFLSAWKNKVLETNSFNFSEEEHEQMKNLDHFIDWVKKIDIKTCDEHLREQCSLIDLNNVDFIGRFENFEEDFEYVTRKIGISYQNKVHVNKSNELEFSISNKNKTDIAHIYSKDIRLFYPDDINLLKGKN